jgi:hypothetical protein
VDSIWEVDRLQSSSGGKQQHGGKVGWWCEFKLKFEDWMWEVERLQSNGMRHWQQHAYGGKERWRNDGVRLAMATQSWLLSLHQQQHGME